ncbi:unnamed protein product [Ceratitis capitata]|uniref:(Mediterranean fruit fly) hypothetical protein n=1 Tax=Ceratitis capitata TaxID=7213 RepID=A0A811VHU2_CERCA|nr:unnamed protein product [Ceratitis capitata]
MEIFTYQQSKEIFRRQQIPSFNSNPGKRVTKHLLPLLCGRFFNQTFTIVDNSSSRFKEFSSGQPSALQFTGEQRNVGATPQQLSNLITHP